MANINNNRGLYILTQMLVSHTEFAYEIARTKPACTGNEEIKWGKISDVEKFWLRYLQKINIQSANDK